MWDWLDAKPSYSSGAAYPIIAIMLLVIGASLLYGGLLILKTRTVLLPVGTDGIQLQGFSAVALAGFMCAGGVLALVALGSLLLH